MSEEKTKKTYYTQAQNKATQKYIHNSYDQIIIRVRKDLEPTRATIAQAASNQGQSLNAFIMDAILEKMNKIDHKPNKEDGESLA